MSFAKARKEIAKVCLASGVQPGEYRGRAATDVIRKMQTSIVTVFEDLISSLQQADLHKRILNYLSVQQNGTIVNIKRYTAFAGLDEDVQQEFERETRSLREDYRRNTGTALYLLESNLAVSHIDNAAKCNKADFEYLLAFADWLVVLQDAADTCLFAIFQNKLTNLCDTKKFAISFCYQGIPNETSTRKHHDCISHPATI